MKFKLLLFILLIISQTGLAQSKHKKIEILSKKEIEIEKKALLVSHKNERAAHFNLDVNAMVENSIDSFIYVGNGSINYDTKINRKTSTSKYFNNAKYEKWDNLSDPIIRISTDGTMAWMITHIEVERTQKDESGKINNRKFDYAGVMLYWKEKGIWVKEANVSTFK